jgi:hypothetical protein
MSLVRFEYNSLTVINSLDYYLGQRHIGEFKILLILSLLKAYIKDIDSTTE